MNIKKMIVAALSIAMSAPITAVGVSAETEELVYGTDYICAAYFNNAEFTSDVSSDFLLTGTVFDRGNGGDGNTGYYVSYAVLDISGVDVESVSYTAEAAQYGDYPVRVFVTDNESIASEAPSAAIVGTKHAGKTDLAEKGPTYGAFSEVYELTQMSITSDDNTYTASITENADYLVLAFCGWKTTTLDTLTLNGTVKPQDYAAEMDGQYYATLDEAMSNAYNQTSKTIMLYKDSEYSGTNYYAKTGNTTTIKSADGNKKTITLTTDQKNVFTWNGIELENIILKSEAENIGNIYEYQKTGNNGVFTFKNCEITGINTSDCFSVAYTNNVYNTKVSENSVRNAIFANRMNSTIENSIITGNTAEGIGVVEITNSSATTIKNSEIRDNNTGSHGDVNIKGGSTAILSGNTVIDDIYFDSTTSKLMLTGDFNGSANLKNVLTDEGTVLAAVEDGANVSGITVAGLDTDNYKLEVQGGNLVIVKKTAEQTINTYNTGVSNGDDGSVATSFITEVTGGSFNRIQWTVKSGDAQKPTEKFTLTTVDLTAGGSALFGLVVDGLNDGNAEAEAAVTME